MSSKYGLILGAGQVVGAVSIDHRRNIAVEVNVDVKGGLRARQAVGAVRIDHRCNRPALSPPRVLQCCSPPRPGLQPVWARRSPAQAPNLGISTQLGNQHPKNVY